MADIEHSETEHCFSIHPQGAAEAATLKYVMLTEDKVDFVSTFVPPALRNQGLAEKLVREGLKWARDNQFNIEASCWYVDKFLQRGR